MCLVVVICIVNYFQHKATIKQSKQADIGIRICKVINRVKESRHRPTYLHLIHLWQSYKYILSTYDTELIIHKENYEPYTHSIKFSLCDTQELILDGS